MYAVFIAGKVSSELQRQVIVAHYQGNNYVWYRTTNGGRGESNSWVAGNYNELIQSTITSTDIPLLNPVVGTILTDVDTTAINNNEIPNVLIQKLSKQFRSNYVFMDSSRTMRDVIEEVDNTITTDPNLLCDYWTDKRRTKTTERNNVKTITTPVITTEEPVIQIVREGSLAFVPTLTNEISGYIERKFADGLTETQIFDHAIKNGLNVRIVGEAGTGKTISTMAYAHKRGLNYYRVDFHAGIENAQLFGKFIPDGKGGLVWQDGGFTECWRNGNSLIHLDELSFMLSKQSGSLMPCLADTRTLTLLDNKGEVIPAGKNLLIVGSYNENYRGNNKLNQALEDRFYHKLIYTYDREIEKNFIPSSTLLTLAEQMRADSLLGTYETPISTRLLKNFVKSAKELSYDYAVESFVNSFTAEERASVKLLFDAHRHNLEQELTGKIN